MLIVITVINHIDTMQKLICRDQQVTIIGQLSKRHLADRRWSDTGWDIVNVVQEVLDTYENLMYN